MKAILHVSVVVFFALSMLACQNKKSKSGATPNILLIVADDLGWRDIRCYGNDLVETPNLDQLANEGIRFSNAYASCTVCSPTRAALLTGKNPVTVNITDYIPGKQFERNSRGITPTEKLLVPEFNHELPLQDTTLAEILKTAGYTTISIGKWHLGGEGYLPVNQGFDINIAGNHKGMPPSYYYPYTAERFNFEITHLELNDDSLYLTDRLGNEAVQFIHDHAEEKFFMYLPFYTVHTPWEGRPDLVEKYTEVVENNNDSISRDPHFLAMIESLDQNVGKVLNALERNHLAENTLVIFVSDNGGLFIKRDDQVFGSWNYPLRGGKGTLYEGGLRVPTILRWPGNIKPGQVSDELMISTDILPTILEAVNQPINLQTEGVSLWQHVTAEQPVEREKFFWHYPHYHRTKPGSVIRDGDYKCIYYYEDERIELYNLKNDPGETNNLAGKMPEKSEKLKAQLDSWLKLNHANFPKSNSNYNIP